MGKEVGLLLRSKNVLLLSKIADEMNWPDKEICDDLVSGFYLTGMPKLSGVFPPEASLRKMTVDQLDASSSIIKMQLWQKIVDSHADKEVWDITNKESDEDGWLSGPLGFDEIEKRFSYQVR